MFVPEHGHPWETSGKKYYNLKVVTLLGASVRKELRMRLLTKKEGAGPMSRIRPLSKVGL